MEAQDDPPKALQEWEPIFDDLAYMWSAFLFLNSGRNGLDAIRLNDIIFYFRDYLGGDDLEQIQADVRIIRAMDLAFIRLSREKDGT